MTVTQVVGIKLPLSTICNLLNDEKVDESSMDDIVNFLYTHNEELIDEKSNIYCYRMTHDIYSETDTDSNMIVGIPVLSYAANTDGDGILEITVLTVEELLFQVQLMKDWILFKGLSNLSPTIYTVVDDCSCCN